MKKQPNHLEIPPDGLFSPCDPGKLGFTSTDNLRGLKQPLGQERAMEAIQFATGINQEGYNLFAMGSSGAGKRAAVLKFLKNRADGEAAPPDWCYVHDFDKTHRPSYLELPAGEGKRLRLEMEKLVEELQAAIPAAFETEDYRRQRQQIDESFSGMQEKAVDELREKAKPDDVALVRTPSGLAFAPVRDGEVIPPDEFSKLSEKKRKKWQRVIEDLQEELAKLLHQRPRWRREAQNRVKKLSRDVVAGAVSGLFEEIKKKFNGMENVLSYLDRVREDVVEQAEHFHQIREGEQHPAIPGFPVGPGPDQAEAIYRNYRVNVIVDHSKSKGAPVVYEDNPSFPNLLGRIEHFAHMGALMTDFTLIKAGALHRANGGYLVLDAVKVLTQPYAWEALKRALRSGEIRTESIGQMLNLVSTVTLDPRAIPLRLKIVLVGERWMYRMLQQHDPDFGDTFKVAADFEEDINRGARSLKAYARLIAGTVQERKLRPFDHTAVARVIEHASRLSGDALKLSVGMRDLTSVLTEADFQAGKAKRKKVAAADVERAIQNAEKRLDRVRDRYMEEFSRGRLLLDCSGEKIGQINALSVLDTGAFRFGIPNRITAQVRMGPGRVVDIEREVEMGGALHSKGVLILSGYLAGHFLPTVPLSLAASLVFEQNYGGVDGDSASSAELYAILSALARVPLGQHFAVTGSVNQLGEVQAIGGVNEKIEGFFDLCKSRRLSGRQGVLIPASNRGELMLRRDVVEAARKGRFHVHAVSTIAEGIELLTGLPAGERGVDGLFPDGTVFRLVEERLRGFAETSRDFHHPRDNGKGNA